VELPEFLRDYVDKVDKKGMEPIDRLYEAVKLYEFDREMIRGSRDVKQ
jgi:hypothetical protein